VSETSLPSNIALFTTQPTGVPAGRTKYLPAESPEIVNSPFTGCVDGNADPSTSDPFAGWTSSDT
jgi:hypothetical protein